MTRRVNGILSVGYVMILAAVCGASGAARATEPKPAKLDCALGFERLKQSIEALPDAKPSETADWEMVQVNSSSISESDWWIALHVFTKTHHYAYPTVTRKVVWKVANGPVMNERTACGYGPKPLFDKVMREFEDLDRRMREAIEAEHRQRPNP